MQSVKHIIVAGSRDFRDYDYLESSLLDLYGKAIGSGDIKIISGGARGADSLGEQFANTWHLTKEVYPANWAKWGKSAGHIRNGEMGKVGDELVAFWDGKSRGTQGMIDIMVALKKPVHIFGFSGG